MVVVTVPPGRHGNETVVSLMLAEMRRMGGDVDEDDSGEEP